MIRAELSPATERIEIQSEFMHKDAIKLVGGARWSPDTRRWSAPLSWATCLQLRGVFGQQLEIGPSLAAWARNERATRVDPAMALRERLEPEYSSELLEKIIASLPIVPYPHQIVGAQFMRTAEQALISDEPGTGKSLSTSLAVRLLHEERGDALPLLVICPNSVKRVWRRELARVMPDLEPIIITGGASGRRKQLERVSELAEAGTPVAAIINWEAVALHSRLAPYGSVALKKCERCGGDPAIAVTETRCHAHLKELNGIPFATVITDEAHVAKEAKNACTRAAWWVAHKARYRFALTGTPIANHVGDLWSIMHMLAPDEWPSKTRTLDRYALLSWNAFGGLDIIGVRPDTRDEFFGILDPRFRRMRKEQVLPFLPPKVYEERYVTLGGKQRKAYTQMAKHMIALVEDDDQVIATNPLAQLTRLMQFSSATAYVDDDNVVQLAEPSSKIDELVAVLEDIGDAPAAISAESRKLIDLAAVRLTKEKISYAIITGGMTEEQRDQAERDFQEGRVRCILFTLKAGGIGLTFTRAGVLIRLQRSFSQLSNVQGEDRTHRIGSEVHDKIMIIDLIAEDTVEEDQLELLSAKTERAEEVVRDRDALRKMLERKPGKGDA